MIDRWGKCPGFFFAREVEEGDEIFKRSSLLLKADNDIPHLSWCLHFLHCSLVHNYSCLHLLAIRPGPFEDMAGDFLRRVYEGRGGDAVFTKSFIFCIQRLHHLEPHSPWRQELALKGHHWGVVTHPLIWSTTSFLPKRALSGGFCLTNAAMNYWLPFFSKVVNSSVGASSLSQMK